MVNKKEETKTAVVTANPTALVVLPEEKPLIADERVLQLVEETLEGVREDRLEASERYLQFCDMVVNSGDCSSATKEALVNLLKIRNDALNQNIKVLDIFARIKLKERATPSQIHAFQQNNKYEVANAPSPQIRNLIKMAQSLDSEKVE